jgi:Gpi18-like mannosyltransferase
MAFQLLSVSSHPGQHNLLFSMRKNHNILNIFILWVILRIVTSLFAAFTSPFRPITSLEINIPLLPPSAPISQWLNRVILAPWMRWDAMWFSKIVSQGYSTTDITPAYHPLYPWLATPLSKIGISPELSLLIISALAGIALFFCFYKFAHLDLSPNDAFFALLVFSFSPLAFIFFAPYSESLFILLAVLCLYFLRKKSWWLAGIMGGLATLTRQQGLFLVFPMAWELWENSGRSFTSILKRGKDLLATGAIVSGMLVWIGYRALVLNDFSLHFNNIQGFIYSTIISPNAIAIFPAQKFVWPWQALYYAIEKLLTKPDPDIWVNILLALLYLIVLSISWKELRMSYKIYSLAITVVSFSYYTGPIHPYMGLPRHLLLAFPISIGITAVIKKTWIRLVFIGISLSMMIFLLVLYVLNAWVP